MSDSEKPKSWRERRKKIKKKWHVPFIYLEWRCERLSYWLGQWAFLDILGHAGRLTILIAVIFYIKGCTERQRQAEDQRKAKHYQAWQVINAAQGKTGDGGRMDALQELHRDGISLAGVDISKAHLRALNLENALLMFAKLNDAYLYKANLSGATLANANLSDAYLAGSNLSGAMLMKANLSGASFRNADLIGANLYYANLTGTDLYDADLAEANLYCADIAEITGWQRIKSIEFANIYGIKGQGERFIEWAKEHGAVSIESYEEWERFLQEKRREKKKQKQ
jgi:hypothetical protein